MRIDHVNIVVSDMDRAVAFYEGVLGLRRGFEVMLGGEWIETVTGIEGTQARCVFIEPPEGGARIELLQYRTPQGAAVAANSLANTPGIRHMAFVVEDMEAFLARLDAAGVPTMSPPVEVPFVVGAMGRKRLCYFHDPDGTLLEAAAYG